MASRNEVIQELRRQISSIGRAGATTGREQAQAPSDAAVGDDQDRGRVGADRVKGAGGACPDGQARAFEKIVALVNASDRSEKAVRERLQKLEFAPGDIESAVDRAKGYGFIDDGRFAAVLIRSRLSQGKGVAGIERELLSHDIDPGTVEGWPQDYGVDEESEVERALEVLKRRPPKSKNLREGAYRKLMQKGYASPVASRAARTWYDALDFS